MISQYKRALRSKEKRKKNSGPYRPEIFFPGPIFITAQVVFVTATIAFIFMSLSAVQISDFHIFTAVN